MKIRPHVVYLCLACLLFSIFSVACDNSKDSTVSKAGNTELEKNVGGLLVDFPATPIFEAVELPSGASSIISAANSYTTTHKGVKIGVTHAVYSSKPADLQASVDGAVSMVKSLPRVSKVSQKVESMMIDELNGSKVMIEYTDSGVGIKQHSILLTRGKELWSIQIVGSSSNQDFIDIAESVFSSLRLPQ